MKEEMIQKMTLVLNALNNISVSGKQNLGNLSGSIAIIEDVIAELQAAEVTQAGE